MAFDQENEIYFFKCKITFNNDTDLFVIESFRKEEIHYSYHWQDRGGKLLIRWDNAPHHKKIETYPYHMHNPDVQPSSLMNLQEILDYIEKLIQN